jgi:hypothetical protein
VYIHVSIWLASYPMRDSIECCEQKTFAWKNRSQEEIAIVKVIK